MMAGVTMAGVTMAGVTTAGVTTAGVTTAVVIAATGGESCLAIFCAVTAREDERHKRTASERTTLPMTNPGGCKSTLLPLKTPRAVTTGFARGEIFFRTRKISQPQSSCIYINIGKSKRFRGFSMFSSVFVGQNRLLSAFRKRVLLVVFALLCFWMIA